MSMSWMQIRFQTPVVWLQWHMTRLHTAYSSTYWEFCIHQMFQVIVKIAIPWLSFPALISLAFLEIPSRHSVKME